jgi:hypothetical protein
MDTSDFHFSNSVSMAYDFRCCLKLQWFVRKLNFLFLVLIIALSSNANPTSWFDGVLVLKGNEIVKGQMSLKSDMEVVLVKSNEKVTVYPAHRILFFYYYDDVEGKNRNFISMEKRKGAARRFLLFETIVEGELSVLRKEKSNTPHVMVDQAIEYIYFIHWDNELMALRKFRTKVYPRIINAMGSQIKTYIENNKLDPHLSSDAIQIIDYYNQCVSSQPMVARF